ncbi:hypothetical protein [Gluconobacter oxydans]|uniref:hypothetical protein n=1 Tax=Gluconobacter oxydans TaxID=442 RepID=UPI002647AA01|nr:hypothetical protein [Gluconobacter oxydans]WKE49665.1 hypothetical protein NUJ38_14145 [Gluconobacter oxydans]
MTGFFFCAVFGAGAAALTAASFVMVRLLVRSSVSRETDRMSSFESHDDGTICD